jgi:acyl carrier protein
VDATQGNLKAMNQDQFVELLSDWFRANKQTSDNLQITADTELLGSGLLDSFDFLDLIVFIESKTGRKIDLSVADPNQFSLVRGLWSMATGGDEAGPATHGSNGGAVPMNAA